MDQTYAAGQSTICACGGSPRATAAAMAMLSGPQLSVSAVTQVQAPTAGGVVTQGPGHGR